MDPKAPCSLINGALIKLPRIGPFGSVICFPLGPKLSRLHSVLNTAYVLSPRKQDFCQRVGGIICAFFTYEAYRKTRKVLTF